jgi:signal peptidase I
VGDGVPSRPSTAEQSAALALVNRRRWHVWRRLGWFFEWAKVASLAVVLFLFVRAFVVEAYKIPSGSMEGTILVGDFLLVNKLVYGATVPFTGRRLPRIEAPARGDIVVFEWPRDRRKNLIKRLVGLPGDTLGMRDGVLFVNGRAQPERYAVHTEPGSDPTYDAFDWQQPFVVRTAIAAPAPARARRDPSAHPSRDNWGPLTVPPASTSSSATTATTRSTAGSGASCPTRCSAADRSPSTTATRRTAPPASRGPPASGGPASVRASSSSLRPSRFTLADPRAAAPGDPPRQRMLCPRSCVAVPGVPAGRTHHSTAVNTGAAS